MLQRYEECARVLGKGHIFSVDKMDKMDKKHKVLICIVLTCGQTLDKWHFLSIVCPQKGIDLIERDGFDRGKGVFLGGFIHSLAGLSTVFFVFFRK